jgi:hypothetical protein
VNPRTFLRLSQYRGFWRLRARIQRLRFSILGRLFRARYFARQERTNAGILISILKLTGPQLFLAIGVAASLQVVELLLVPQLINRWAIPDTANYVSWLGTIAQIGGVFIALYFTAVTAAAGAIYAQVPNNIRDLLARERFGNIYIRYLTLATFLPVCLVGLHFLGFEPMRIAVPLLALVIGMGIIAFTALGWRAFNLFDPTRLAGSLFVDLGAWLAQASTGGFRWKDRSFQAHAHRQTASVVDTLQTLSDLAATHANLDSAPLLELTMRVLALLAEYQQRKLRIPTDSLWFEQKYEHKSWYQTEDSTVQLAHRTGTSLSPTSVAEYNWLENRLQPIPLKCFELNVGRKRLDNVRDLLAGVDAYIAALATSGNVQGAVPLAQKIQAIYEQASSGSAPAAEKQEERAEDVGMADAVCFLPLRILVAYRAALEQRTPELTKKRIESLRWDKAKSLYTGGFITEELRQLEWLLPRMKMESDVEETIQTPVWYQWDLVSKSQAESLSESVGAIIESGNKFFQNWSDRLVKAGRVWQSAAVLSRYLEYLNKLEYHFSFFKTYADSLSATRHLTDLPWPDIKPGLWCEAVRGLRELLVQTMASHIVLISASQRPEGVPDYLGQFIHETGENLFDSLLGRRAEVVQALIRPYLAGTLVLFERMKPSTPKPDVWTEQKLQIAAAPVLDILELSGYGKLLSELYADEQLWSVVSGVWDQLLEKSPGTLPWLAAIITGGTPRFQIPHRGLVRTTWSMRVQQELNRLPHRNSLRGGASGIFGSDVIHSSALVRYCARYDFHNGRDIFAALYLSKKPGAEGLEWGREASDLVESLQREEESYENGEENEEEE